MSAKENAIDVLVVGAGPVGLTMACELLRHGVQCRIIDQQSTPVQESRALNVQARTLEVFENMGVIDQILSSGTKARGLTIYDGESILLRMSLQHIREEESLYPFLLILPQSQTERILGERLAELGGTVERSRQLVDIRQEDHTVIALVKATGTNAGADEEIHARWLIGCDGIIARLASHIETLANGAVKAHIIVVGSEKPAQLTWNGSTLLDPQGALHITYGARRQALYFVRPDGYIGFRSQPASEKTLLEYLSKFFSL